MKKTQSRRDLLKSSTTLGISASLAALVGCNTARLGAAESLSETPPRPETQKPVHTLTTKPLEKVRVACIGTGGRGSSLMGNVTGIEFAEITVVCDLITERAENCAKRVEKAGHKKPVVIGGSDDAWKAICTRDDVDVVYVATPWELHTPMAVLAMENGKHAFVEVSAAVGIDECWNLVNTSERTQRHCVMLENCCYGENELFVLNMARKGVFGELTHAECAYIHDLRGLLFHLNSEGAWRREYHKDYDGNLYPTHGLGPVAQYLGVGRGDQFDYLVSMSSPEKGLTKWRNEKNPNKGEQKDEVYKCGDMNTSLIKTVLGRSIMIQHDVISPRPYSRINMLSGTGGTFVDYPARLAINEPKTYNLSAKGSHGWINDADMAEMRKQFTHPLWEKLKERAKNSGHGGMDFVMNYRHLDCIRTGHTPDSVVYDAAAWSSILALSSWSVANRSAPINIPDFTRGAWKTLEPLPVVS